MSGRITIYTPATGDTRIIPDHRALVAAVIESLGADTVQIRRMAIASAPAEPESDRSANGCPDKRARTPRAAAGADGAATGPDRGTVTGLGTPAR